MKIKFNISYNLYFLLPFAAWVLSGGVLLSYFDKETLFKFFNSRHSAFADTLLPFITMLGEGWFITLVLVSLMLVSVYRSWAYFVLALLSTALPSLVTQLLKSNFAAPRPLKYFSGVDWIHILPHWPRLMERSFPSGHSCGAFGLFCLLALLLPRKYQPLGIVFFLLALLVAISRIYLAAHFFEDIYAGSILGVIFTLFAVITMKRFQHIFTAEKQ